MLYPKIPLAQNLIKIFIQKGIKHIIISPGSRNAPLTIGFASNPNFTCYSIADERSAAFFALGIAQQIQKPVAVVCTSGSALLNYYPALAEAFYSQIPLIVVSADRPLSKIDIGDGQTIRQQNVFENHSLYNANLTEEASAENDSEIYQAIATSVLKKGPVHINVPFEEPLYDTVDLHEDNIAVSIEQDIITFNEETYQPVEANFINTWNGSKKKLLLIGANYPNQIEQEIIEKLAKDPSVVVMTETTSNLHHPNFVNKIDVLITPFTDQDFQVLQPDLLITFAGMIVSKRIKAFLRKYSPAQHWHIDPLRAYDTFGVLTHHIKTQPNNFLQQLLSKTTTTTSSYNSWMQQIKAERHIKHQQFIQQAPYSDFKILNQIARALPDGIQTHISNSAAIRYVQLFDMKPSVEVFCNRGTSGIDGSSSTAVGASVATKKPVVLISGDVSFFYDSNALWNNYIREDFKIIIINNAGGGIFRILPGHQKNEMFSTYFETSHQLNASHLAKMFDFAYFSAQNELETTLGLQNLFASDKKAILEIFTPTQINDAVLKNYFKALA